MCCFLKCCCKVIFSEGAVFTQNQVDNTFRWLRYMVLPTCNYYFFPKASWQRKTGWREESEHWDKQQAWSSWAWVWMWFSSTTLGKLLKISLTDQYFSDLQKELLPGVILETGRCNTYKVPSTLPCQIMVFKKITLTLCYKKENAVWAKRLIESNHLPQTNEELQSFSNEQVCCLVPHIFSSKNMFLSCSLEIIASFKKL